MPRKKDSFHTFMVFLYVACILTGAGLGLLVVGPFAYSLAQ